MAVNVNSVFQYCAFQISKIAGQYIKPADFNTASNDAQTEILAETVMVGTDGFVDELRTDMTYLYPFKKEITVSINSSGIATIPTDYLYASSLYKNIAISPTKSKPYPIKLVNDDRAKSVLTSWVVFPTKTRMYCQLIGANMKFYPINTNNAVLTYFRQPTTAVFGYTVTGSRYVYNPATSVNFELPFVAESTLQDKILLKLAIILERPDLYEAIQNQIKLK